MFQTGFDGSEKDVADRDDAMDFGTGSLFVQDPDGNLIEFLQLGHGIFDSSESDPDLGLTPRDDSRSDSKR